MEDLKLKVNIYGSYLFLNFEKIDNEEKQLKNSLERVRNLIHNIENNMLSYKYAIIQDIVEYYFKEFKSTPHCIYIVNDNNNEFVMGIDYNPKFKEPKTTIDKKIRVYNKKVIVSDYTNNTGIEIFKFDKDTKWDDFINTVLHKAV